MGQIFSGSEDRTRTLFSLKMAITCQQVSKILLALINLVLGAASIVLVVLGFKWVEHNSLLWTVIVVCSVHCFRPPLTNYHFYFLVWFHNTSNCSLQPSNRLQHHPRTLFQRSINTWSHFMSDTSHNWRCNHCEPFHAFWFPHDLRRNGIWPRTTH